MARMIRNSVGPNPRKERWNTLPDVRGKKLLGRRGQVGGEHAQRQKRIHVPGKGQAAQQ